MRGFFATKFATACSTRLPKVQFKPICALHDTVDTELCEFSVSASTMSWMESESRWLQSRLRLCKIVLLLRDAANSRPCCGCKLEFDKSREVMYLLAPRARMSFGLIW